AAAGLLFALMAALTKVNASLARAGLRELLGHWPPYALLAVGGAAVLLVQSAYQAGPLSASLPVIMVVEPLASVGIGTYLCHEHARLLTFDVNQGMSAAYYLAFTHLRERTDLHPGDLVYTVDADGQHDLATLDELQRIATSEGLDALLACRDLSGYPPHKRAGNWLLSAWASLWAGKRL